MEFTSFLICSTVLIFLFVKAERTNNAFLKWSGRIIPPLSLLILIFVPFDFISVFAWGLGFIFVIFSLVNIAIITSNFVIRKIQHKKPNFNLLELIRPLLCISAFIIARLCLIASISSANEKAIELALKENENFLMDKSCLSKDSDWKNNPFSYEDDDSLHIKYGNFGTKYFITYHCNKGYFKFNVRVNKDTDFHISNNSSGELQVSYGHYMSPYKTTIDENTDLKKLARMKLHN